MLLNVSHHLAATNTMFTRYTRERKGRLVQTMSDTGGFASRTEAFKMS